MLSKLVSEMVIVTVPPLALAAMAPPYKVDVPPPDIQEILRGFFLSETLKFSLTAPLVAMLLLNSVPEMVIVTAPLPPSA